MGTRTYSRRRADGTRALTRAGRERARIAMYQQSGLAEESTPITAQSIETLPFPPSRNKLRLEDEYTPQSILNDEANERRMIDRYRQIARQKRIDTNTPSEQQEITDLYDRLKVHRLGLIAIANAMREPIPVNPAMPSALREAIAQDNAQLITLSDAVKQSVNRRLSTLNQLLGISRGE